MSRAPAGGALACLCIAGPTASGKSRVAMAFAERLAPARAVEIVSVDSAQVYRGMDIGTAKPSAAERAAVPHHLIDLIDPAERYSAARFVADATAKIDEIAARGAMPLLVGGTMLYFKALFDGLDALPEADAAVREALDARAGREGWPALHAELAAVDPPTAARLAPTDAQRIQRALEVHAVSGRPLSAFHTARPRGAPPALISLEPQDRTWLHARIGERFQAMLDAGLVDEVRELRRRLPLLRADMPSMRSVGYRQVFDFLEGRIDRASLRERGIAATRQLARRQLTWLRAMDVEPIEGFAADAAERVTDRAQRAREAADAASTPD